MIFNIFASFVLLAGSLGVIDSQSTAGADAYFDEFPVLEGISIAEEAPLEQVAGATALSPEYKVFTYSTPLKQRDYYWGKYNNAKLGAAEVNRMPTLIPGNRISLIGGGYLTVGSKGYVNPGRGYYYASGLCWVASTMGGMMDQANAKFKKQYGMNLFVFRKGDRSGHSHKYTTYATSNNGYGYAVMKVGTRKGRPDYTFQINPQVKNIPGFSDVKVQIKMVASSNYKGAYKGQAMSAVLYSNKDIFGTVTTPSAVKSSNTTANDMTVLPNTAVDQTTTTGLLSCVQTCSESGLVECVNCLLKTPLN